MRRRTFWGSTIALLLIVPPLIGWAGFCWRGWLGSSALVQHLLQCRCPAESEAVRYHPFLVLAPACSDPLRSHVSHDTQWLLYKERAGERRLMVVNLSSLQQDALPVPPDTRVDFLTPTLFLLSSVELVPTFTLYDRTTARFTQVASQDLWEKNLTDDLIIRAQRARMVYVSTTSITILAPSAATDATEGVILNAGSAGWVKTLRAQLDAAQVSYVLDPVFAYPSVAPDAIDSTDGQLRADRGGITRITSGESLQSLPPPWAALDPPWQAELWVPHNRAVVYRRNQTTIGNSNFLAGMAPWLIVPQPLLLLPVPANAGPP